MSIPFVSGGRLRWSLRGLVAVSTLLAFCLLPVRGLYRATGSSIARIADLRSLTMRTLPSTLKPCFSTDDSTMKGIIPMDSSAAFKNSSGPWAMKNESGSWPLGSTMIRASSIPF